MMTGRHAIAVSTLLVALLAHAETARGQDARDKLRDLNKQALVDYKGGDFESAKLSLLEAIGIATKAGLSDSPLMARTYAHLGAIYVNGFKDKAKGQKALVTALKIRSDLKLTEETVTPELLEVFAAAQKELGIVATAPAAPEKKPVAAPPPPPPPPPAERKPQPFAEKAPPPAPPPKETPVVAKKRSSAPEEPDLPATIAEPLYCPNPDEAPPKEPIALRCVAQPTVKVARVLLYYRVGGGEKFATVRTVRSPKGWWNGVIPANAVVGKILHYYFEARDPSDQVAASSGRNESPNIMIIKSGAPPVGKGALAMVRFQRRAEGGGGGEGPDENPLAEIAEEREREERDMHDRRRRSKSVFVGVGGGSGYGYQPSGDRPLEFYGTEYRDERPGSRMVYPAKSIGPSWLPAGMADLVIDVGYQWTESLAFSLQGRIQFISSGGEGDPRPGRPATGAMAVFARAQYLMGEDNLQWVLSGVVGGGDGFRLTVAHNKDAGVPRNDSVRGGPLVLGPGFGPLFHITKHVAVTAELRALAGVPDLAFLADLWGGVQFGF